MKSMCAARELPGLDITLMGTKHTSPASYVLWWKKAYACSRFMAIGDHPARRLERRWATRYSFRADLEIEWGSAVLRGSTRDISASGMFIEAVDPLWVGAGFTARLNLKQPQ